MKKFFQLGILGMTGTGKSHLTGEIIQHLNRHYNRIIIIDDLRQVEFNNGIECNNIEQFINLVVNKKCFKIICRFLFFEDYETAFQIIWLLNSTLLVIDELSLYCDCFNISEALRNISQRGRIKNISLIWNTQRPANINRNISSQNEFIISFKLSENDLKYFYIDRTKLLSVQSLEKYSYGLLRGDPVILKKVCQNYSFRLTF